VGNNSAKEFFLLGQYSKFVAAHSAKYVSIPVEQFSTGANALAQAIRLTAGSKAGGCAAKMSPRMLDAVLKRLPASSHPAVIVGYETSDDAGVYRLNDDLALVQTVDFFTPIVDDPFAFGQIAAANALSDVYAMGGRPLSALSMVGFPAAGSPDVLEQIFRGGLSKMTEAECAVLGGHSIRDEEIKFGYAVTGVIHPSRVWRNVGARESDVLLFTKRLGTGVIATALKQERAPEFAVSAAIASMTQLNRATAAALLAFEKLPGHETPIHAVTDVTGFGLLGHAREMALPSGISLEIDHTQLEFLPGALDAARGGFISGGLRNNREFVEDCVRFADGVSEEIRLLMFDPQTSGGLLVAIAAPAAGAAHQALADAGISAQIIGRVVAKGHPLIQIV
jgi:selenide,water dikinase